MTTVRIHIQDLEAGRGIPGYQYSTSSFVPYSEWSQGVIKNIKKLSDECLDRFYDDKKVNVEILKMLSKLQDLVEKKYKE
jgi:hypothetical protein